MLIKRPISKINRNTVPCEHETLTSRRVKSPHPPTAPTLLITHRVFLSQIQENLSKMPLC